MKIFTYLYYVIKKKDMTDFNFSFKTAQQRVDWEWRNELVNYDCVRITCYCKNGMTVGYPSRSEEEFNADIERMDNDSRVEKYEVRQETHFYEEKC